jgi:hypothetical protein
VAADVTGEELTPAAPEQPAALAALPASPEPKRAGLSPHRYRFLVVYGILAIALGAAAAGVVVFAGRSINPAPKWSAWRPGGGGLGAERQIADHVSPTYRLPSGKQLVDVIAKAPSIAPGKQTIPIHYVAIRAANGSVSADSIFDVSPSNSVMYSLCGLGSNCSIATGTPSVARGRLVRREILELALYTFKYVGGVQNVIAFMPPQPGATPQYVVYLRKSDLTAELEVPLDDTLRAKTPLPNTIPAHEVQLVDGTTNSRVFSFSLSQAQQGDAILVLDPLPA